MDPAVPSQELWCDMKIGGLPSQKVFGSIGIMIDYDYY